MFKGKGQPKDDRSYDDFTPVNPESEQEVLEQKLYMIGALGIILDVVRQTRNHQPSEAEKKASITD